MPTAMKTADQLFATCLGLEIVSLSQTTLVLRMLIMATIKVIFTQQF